MSEKKVSSFATVYIIGGMLYILFLFYYIGTEIQNVKKSDRIIAEKQEELVLLENMRNKRLKTKQIMLTPQYKDRINKEIDGGLNDGEKEFIITFSKNNAASLLEEPSSEVYWQRPAIEEWKSIFFHE